MKVKIELPGECAAWLAVDGRASEQLVVGGSRVVECKEFTIAGNPIDPWRIVVWVQELGLDRLPEAELEDLLRKIAEECSRRKGKPQT